MQDQNNKQFWQRFAKIYAPLMEKDKHFYSSICASVRPHLQADMDVLELACGSGQLSFPLAPDVHSWLATDFSEKMIAAAKARPEAATAGAAGLRFEVADATALAFPDASFDAVLIANALHIMPEPEKALAEIRRVLKADGLLFAPTFLWLEGKSGRIRHFLMSLVGFKIYREWDQAAFRQVIEDAGFEVLEMPLINGGLSPVAVLSARRR